MKIYLGIFLLLIAPLLHANEYHEKILKMSEKEKVVFFEEYLRLSGKECRVQKPFLQGHHVGEDGYFWNVRCKRGEDLAIYLQPNGNSRILECSILAQLGLNCFIKLED